MASKVLATALASVNDPIKHFIETGFWSEPDVDWQDDDRGISPQQVRRICRRVAVELKRPFIELRTVFKFDEARDTGGVNQYGQPIWEVKKLPEPIFMYGYIDMPKRKKLAPLVAPLLLAKDSAVVNETGHVTLWGFRVFDQALWNEYVAFVTNDPECRKARGLTS